tara:strand:+ start:545 stop:1051 length:507 start_codon:yes stop_codon:yes gene_type:complete
MKVVDISDDIHRELGNPTGISIASISHWVRSNIGSLNNYLNTTYSEDSTTLELNDADSVEIGTQEVSILKKMYHVYYYDSQLRTNINTLSTDTIVFVSDQGSSVKKVDRLDVAKQLAQIKKEEHENLTQLIHAYKLSKAAPIQVVGDDTEEGSGLTTKTHPYKRTLNL